MPDYTAAPYQIPYLKPGEAPDLPYIGQLAGERLAVLLSAMPYGKMWKTANQAYTTPGAAALVAMGAARVVGGVTFTDAADTLTVPMAGLYRIECGLYVGSIGAASYAAAKPLKNGAALDYYQQPTNTADLTVRGWIETNLAANDVISLQGVVGVNASLNGVSESSSCWLSVKWLRDTL